MKSTWLLDIETFESMFFVGIKNYRTQEIITFEISEWQDDRKALYKALKSFDGYLVTFNGVWYDEMVLKFFTKNFKKLKYVPVQILLTTLKQFSDFVINDNHEVISTVKYERVGWTSIDLFLYWSKMLRLSKKISLKSLGIQLGHEEVQELPYHPNHILDKEEAEQVKRYNVVNDLGILEKLFNRMKPDIELRYYINKNYSLECWSMDAPKIAGELLIEDYCRKIYPNLPGAKYHEAKKEFKSIRYPEFTGTIGELLGDFNISFKLPEFQKLYDHMCKSTRDFSFEFPLLHEASGTKIMLTYGIGGCHTVNENEYYVSDQHQIVTSDYGSLYPNIIINWNCIRFLEVLAKYISVKEERMIAKKNGDKAKDTLYKLILNSLSGLLDNKHSALYYPEGALKMRIIGQLILTKTMEIIMLNGWRIVSANTDGVEAIIPHEDFDKYTEALKEAEELFNIGLEHEKYSMIAYKNVNNYIALTEKGKKKRKGLFKYHGDIPLGDSVNEQVVAVALDKYFTENIPIEQTICNPNLHNLHIYDYCCSKKISKNYAVYHNGKQVQNLNRYYFTKVAPYLLKQKKDKSTLEHVNVGEGVTLFNKCEIKDWHDYGINYSHYVKKARTIIDELMSNQRQLELF